MEKNLAINRVEADLNQWRLKEERFSKLFSFSVSKNRALLREKLHYYDRVAAIYKGTKDLEERFTLKMLRQERSRIEKQLYPNLLLRLFRRLLVVPVRKQMVVRQDTKRTEENSLALQHNVQRTGFYGLSAKIDEQIKLGQQQFSIPVSYYVNDKERLDHQLSFVKDQSGVYQFEGYKTALYNDAKPDENRQQYFSIRHANHIDTTACYNLLSGRCIEREGTWIQLNFTDKDMEGNFCIKQFHSNYGYDLEKALQQLPLKELLHKSEADKLQSELKNGNRVSVSFMKDGKEQRFYIEANPQFKSVNIYDEHSRKITLHTALGNKTAEAVKMTYKINEQNRVTANRKGLRTG